MNYLSKLLIILWTGLLMVSCTKHETNQNSHRGQDLPRIKASLIQVAEEESPTQIEVSGVVRAKTRASIAPKVMGSISNFPIKLGQAVKKGDLLVEINAPEIREKVSQAQTQLRQAQRDLKREQSLFDKEASTAETVRNLEDRVSLMESMVAEAEAMLSYTEIRAPFDGSVSRIYADKGSLAAPGMPLLELDGNSGLEIEAGVPESLVSGQIEGARFQAFLPSNNATFEATAVEVSSASDDQSRSVKVRFSIPQDIQARPGQFARIQLKGSERSKIMVPVAAISQLGQMERVFVVVEDQALLRLVKTGAIEGQQVEVLAGLDAGEWIVIDSTEVLTDGQPLEVTR